MRSFAWLGMTGALARAQRRSIIQSFNRFVIPSFHHSNLSWGPLEVAASDQVHVEMKDGLAGAGADIQHGTIAVFDGALAGDVGGGEVTASY
jgi:hypothetical protein